MQDELYRLSARNQWRKVFDDCLEKGIGFRLPFCDKMTPQPLEHREGRPLTPYGILQIPPATASGLASPQPVRWVRYTAGPPGSLAELTPTTPGQAAWSRRALALAVTFCGSRYRNKVNFGLAVQVWLLTSVLLTLYSV